jgi:hypothetical protein
MKRSAFLGLSATATARSAAAIARQVVESREDGVARGGDDRAAKPAVGAREVRRIAVQRALLVGDPR